MGRIRYVGLDVGIFKNVFLRNGIQAVIFICPLNLEANTSMEEFGHDPGLAAVKLEEVGIKR